MRALRKVAVRGLRCGSTKGVQCGRSHCIVYGEDSPLRTSGSCSKENKQPMLINLASGFRHSFNRETYEGSVKYAAQWRLLQRRLTVLGVS